MRALRAYVCVWAGNVCAHICVREGGFKTKGAGNSHHAGTSHTLPCSWYATSALLPKVHGSLQSSYNSFKTFSVNKSTVFDKAGIKQIFGQPVFRARQAVSHTHHPFCTYPHGCDALSPSCQSRCAQTACILSSAWVGGSKGRWPTGSWHHSIRCQLKVP